MFCLCGFRFHLIPNVDISSKEAAFILASLSYVFSRAAEFNADELSLPDDDSGLITPSFLSNMSATGRQNGGSLTECTAAFRSKCHISFSAQQQAFKQDHMSHLHLFNYVRGCEQSNG